MANDYIRFDEVDDVLASLRLLSDLAPKLSTEAWPWKWAIIAAHSGLQGALVCALSGTAGVGALNELSAIAMLEWLEKNSGDPPKERLADFNTLIKRGCNSQRMSYLGGVPLSLSGQQRRDLRRLNDDFRNNFAHFTPKGWSIERAGLPRIILTAVDAIQHLMAQPQVAYKLEESQRFDLEQSLASINTVLRN